MLWSSNGDMKRWPRENPYVVIILGQTDIHWHTDMYVRTNMYVGVYVRSYATWIHPSVASNPLCMQWTLTDAPVACCARGCIQSSPYTTEGSGCLSTKVRWRLKVSCVTSWDGACCISRSRLVTVQISVTVESEEDLCYNRYPLIFARIKIWRKTDDRIRSVCLQEMYNFREKKREKVD